MPLLSKRAIGAGVQGIFRQFGFYAPLRTSVALSAGSGSASFTRATVATVTDFEGLIKNCLSGEVRFAGARRVQNLFTATTTLSTQGVATIAGTYVVSFTGTGTITFSGTGSGSLVGQGANTRVSAAVTTTAGTLTCTVSGSVTLAQCENVTGQSNQNPSEYVSVGVLSSPYQGAMVDGVKYFDYENPNVVANNIVTDSGARAPVGSYAVAQLPGLSGAYFSTPSTSAITNLTGNVAFLFSASFSNWVPTTLQSLMSKDAGSSVRDFNVFLTTDGKLNFLCYVGGAFTSCASSAATGLSAGLHHILVTREAVTGYVNFYWSDDLSAWTLVGTANRSTTAGAMTFSSTEVEIGANSSGFANNAACGVRRAQIYSGLTATGTPVLDFNPAEGWTENLLTNSFINAATYGGTRATVTASAASDPFGGSTAASLIEDNTATSSHFCGPSLTLNGGDVVEFSVYARTGPGSKRWLVLNSNFRGAFEQAYFDLALGTVSQTAYAGASITSVGNGWYRCVVFGTVQATAVYGMQMMLANAGSGVAYNYSGDGASGNYITGAQFRRLTIASQRTSSQYLPTTTASLRGWIDALGAQWTINGMASVLQSQNNGYLPEGASTNLCKQSSTFASWTAISTPTITDNSVMLGDIGLSLLNDTSGAALQGASMAVTYTGNAQKTVSFDIKQGSSTSSVVRLRDTTASADRLLVAVTWSGGVPVLTYTTGSSERASDALVNGSFRCYALTTSVTAANANQIEVYPATDAALSVGATGTCYLGAVQTEDAAFASSHIPTTTATVTRNADAETYPTAGNFSDTAGTMYFEAFVPNWSAATGVFVGSATNGAKASSANSGVQAFDGTNTANGPAGSPSGWIKAAVAWSGSTMKVCVNGVLGASQSYDGSWNLSSIGMGVGTFALLRNGRIAQAALSDGQMQLITT